MVRLVLHLLAGRRTIRRRFPSWSGAERERAVEQWARQALLICGVELAERGARAPAHGPLMIVANHISNHDLFVFGQVVPVRTVSLGKTSLKWLPVFGQLYWLAGNVLVDRGNAVQAKKAMLTTTDTLQHKDMSLWVFAEGTRNLGKGMKPLKIFL